jgi:hypothetical protein
MPALVDLAVLGPGAASGIACIVAPQVLEAAFAQQLAEAIDGEWLARRADRWLELFPVGSFPRDEVGHR